MFNFFTEVFKYWIVVAVSKNADVSHVKGFMYPRETINGQGLVLIVRNVLYVANGFSGSEKPFNPHLTFIILLFYFGTSNILL